MVKRKTPPSPPITPYKRARKILQKYVGPAAAATLGFAVGDVPGAVGGYKTYNRLSKYFNPMAPTKKRPVYGSAPGPRVTKKVATQYSAGVRKYKAKSVRIKNKRPVKIAAKFRKKVLQAVEAPKSKGTLERVYAGYGWQASAGSANTQVVVAGCFGSNDGYYMFTVDNFVNAASVLFNGAFTLNSALMHQPVFASRIPNYSQKLHIQSSSVQYRLANQTPREYEIKVYEIKPKKTMSYVASSPGTQEWIWNGTSMVATADTEAVNVPDSEWTRALVDDHANGVVSQSVLTYTVQNISDLHNRPTLSPAMKAKWVVALHSTIKIMPGQEANLFIQGPKNLTINLDRTIENTVYKNLQKFSRGLIFCNVPDTTHNGAGFSHSVGTTGGIGMERTDRFVITCPDQVSETFDKNRYVRDIIQGPVSGTAAKTITNEDPTTV